ncbi:MAG: trigger factor [Gemmatimonadota bacterium]
MKIDIEQPRDWARKLTITVPADRVQRERKKVASQYAGRVRMPGFRKGKVPASVVEKQYGASIDNDTMERLINEAYRQALQEKGFQPISAASVENVEYDAGADLTFDVQFEVRPELELERLGGFTVRAPAVDIADADVESVLQRLREQNANWVPVEDGTPAEGDRAKVEITPLQDGEETPEPRQYDVTLGAGEILEAIDQAIRTLEPGAEDEFTIELPGQSEDEGTEEHRIRIKLIGAERPELPEVDDAFAKEVGDFESLELLRERVREDLTAEARRESDREVRRQLVQQVLEANPFEAPPSLVDEYLNSLMQVPDEADPEEVAAAKEQARPAAEHAVRRMLLIDRIAEMENLHPTQADLDQRVEEIAEQNEMEAAEVRRQLAQSGRLQALQSDLMEQRVFEYLKSLSTIEQQG